MVEDIDRVPEGQEVGEHGTMIREWVVAVGIVFPACSSVMIWVIGLLVVRRRRERSMVVVWMFWMVVWEVVAWVV